MDAVDGGTVTTAGPQSPAFGSINNSTVTVMYGGRPFAYSLKRACVPLSSKIKDPSRLLRARAAVVPYVDPARHVDALRGWVSGPESFSVRVIGGRGGSGKTRLAVELCRIATLEGWTSGLLGSLPPESIPTEQVTSGGDTATGAPGMLVVIDYAETRTSELETLLPALQRTAGPARRIRVLLLVRRAPRGNDWTDALRTGDDEFDAILDPAASQQVILEEAAWNLGDREDLYRKSWKAFAERSEKHGGNDLAGAPPTPDLIEDSFGNPLLVAATAYLAVHDPGRTLPDTREGLLDGVLNHEASHWSRSAGRPADPDSTVTRRAAAMAALAGADTETEGAGLLHHLPDLQEATIGVRMAWARWYSRFYPGPRFWNPLEPDLLGEHLIAATLAEFPQTLAAAIDPSRGPNAAQALIVIARIAATSQTPDACPHFNAAAAQTLEVIMPPLTRAAVDESVIPETGLPAGPTIASALAQTVKTLSPHLGDVSESLAKLPHRSVPHVNTLAVELTRHHVSWLRSRTHSSAKAADKLSATLNDHSNRLADSGDRDGALHVIREAVEICRGLAEADPGAYAPDLAMSLNNLSNRLAGAGDHDEALNAIHEAVNIRRILAEADPAAHTPDLASSLNNFSNRLAGSGDLAGALYAVQEGAALYRGLAETDPLAYAPDLAASLNNLSNRLAGTGDHSRALHAIQEATALYRGLANADPAAYTPYLAGALNNLCSRLVRIGDQDGALEAICEAVDFRRGLAEAHPAAYTADLASSLNNLATCLAEKGDHSRALNAIKEAVDFRRHLADTHPAAHTPGLAASLNNLARFLADTGDHSQALNAIKEAVDIRQHLADTHPAAHTPGLAASLTNLARFLADTGDHSQALNAIRQATALYRGLTDTHTPDFVASLYTLSNCLANVGDLEGANDAIHEATAVYGGLTDAIPHPIPPSSRRHFE